jgi:hypothetical protein
MLPLMIHAPATHAALGWRYGESAFSSTFNCINGLPESNVVASVGVLDDIANQLPQAGQSFYTAIRATQVGEAGGCGTALQVTLRLPEGVAIAATVSNPTRCAYAPPGALDFVQLSIAEGCPQPPYPEAAGGVGYVIDSRIPGSPEAPSWPMPRGSSYYFVVPVTSTGPLDPAELNSQMTGYLDGLTSFGTTRAEPTVRVYVAPAPLPALVFEDGFE